MLNSLASRHLTSSIAYRCGNLVHAAGVGELKTLTPGQGRRSRQKLYMQIQTAWRRTCWPLLIKTAAHCLDTDSESPKAKRGVWREKAFFKFLNWMYWRYKIYIMGLFGWD